jgi:kinesin family member 5
MVLQHGGGVRLMPSQNKLEAQYVARRQAHESEVQDLKQQLELKANEIRSLNTTIDGLKSVNEELKVCHFSIRWFVRHWYGG